ncbi:MAG: Diaminopimelate epimerase [Methanomassiliicoccales archaeon PtaU1.Bin124]|nr:MAG: Diaminopimelate epimerase [Methanomassiliicoccales archaeon PtaU1.Bin124]
MRFWKYHGLGNDFIVLENFDQSAKKDPEYVKRLCDRHTGIGADGILYIEKDCMCDARMVVMNSDGSEAEMCGNGIRCVAKHLYDNWLVRSKTMTINTLAGGKSIECTVHNGLVESVVVGMGAPKLDRKLIPMKGEGQFVDAELNVDGQRIVATAVSMGNPHLITFQEFEPEEMDELGPKLERHPSFPKRTNVEFVKLVKGVLEVKVFERGAGWTMACGTGACATAVAAAVSGKVPFGEEVEVRLPGGSLWISVSRDLSEVKMRGPAVLVYRAAID